MGVTFIVTFSGLGVFFHLNLMSFCTLLVSFYIYDQALVVFGFMLLVSQVSLIRQVLVS